MPTSSGFHTTSELRGLWADYACTPDRHVSVNFPTGGDAGKSHPKGIGLPVAAPTEAAWEWFVTVMGRHDVTFDEVAGGSYNCRQITGGVDLSLHAYGIAVDINPSRNPYGTSLVTDFPPDFIGEVLAARTANGPRLFRWGGDWDDDPETAHTAYDAMHWEINCSPVDLATGLEDDMAQLTDDEVEFVRELHTRTQQGLPEWAKESWPRAVAVGLVADGTEDRVEDRSFLVELFARLGIVTVLERGYTIDDILDLALSGGKAADLSKYATLAALDALRAEYDAHVHGGRNTTTPK